MNFKDILNVDSIDKSTLLIDFLSEILTLTHSNKAIYHNVKFKKIEDNFLSAEIEGDKVDAFDKDIKAVTYNEAVIKKNENREYEVTIVFDI